MSEGEMPREAEQTGKGLWEKKAEIQYMFIPMLLVNRDSHPTPKVYCKWKASVCACVRARVCV